MLACHQGEPGDHRMRTRHLTRYAGKVLSMVDWVRLELDVKKFDDADFAPYLQKAQAAGNRLRRWPTWAKDQNTDRRSTN